MNETGTPRSARVLVAITGAWLALFVYLGLASRLPTIPVLTGRGESVALSGHLWFTLVLVVFTFAMVRAYDHRRPTRNVALIAVFIGLMAGGAIELLQNFSRTRSPEAVDLLFDALGAALGVLMMWMIDATPKLRGALVRGVQFVGVGIIALTLSSFLIWPPIGPEEVTAFCPAAAESRRPSNLVLGEGSGARISDGLVSLHSFAGSGLDGSGVEPGLDLLLDGAASLQEHGLRISGDDGIARSAGHASKIHEAVTASHSLTVEAWVRPDDLLNRGPARILSMSKSTSLGEVNLHLGQERTCLSFRIATGGGEAEWILTEGVFVAPRSIWHLVVTFDEGAVSVFADGTLVDQRSVEPGLLTSWDATMPLLVGNEASLDRAFLGQIFLVAIYDRPLTAVEVDRNYQAGPVQ